MKYVIDTDIIIYFLKNHQTVVEKFGATDVNDIATTIINYSELLFGAYNSTQVEQNISKIKLFLEDIQTIYFDKRSAEIFAQLKTDLKKQGNIIADLDLVIASICKANNLVLVTNNTKHFDRIEDLKVENWSVKTKNKV